MDIKEMRELPLAELRSEAGKREATIWKMRFQAKGEPLENSGNYREIKKDRARLLTILREKELVGDDTAPAASEDSSEEATAEDAEEMLRWKTPGRKSPRSQLKSLESHNG